MLEDNSENTCEFDILELLSCGKYETKPNMSKFLKSYVSGISVIISQAKVNMWPKIEYDIWKCIVRFKNNSTIIRDYHAKENCYILEVGLDEIRIDKKHEKTIQDFFLLLEKFRFIRNGKQDVKVFSVDVEKTNQKLEDEMRCVKEETQFRDYTPRITVR